MGARPSAHPLDPRLGHSQSMSQSVSPPYVELKKKLWNTSLVPIQWTKSHDATKMPQLLCVKLEDPNIFTSQALRRSRAVIHLNVPTPLLRSGRSDAPGPGRDPGSTGSFDRMSTQDPGSVRCRSSPQWRSQGASGPRPPKANHRGANISFGRLKPGPPERIKRGSREWALGRVPTPGTKMHH